LSTPPKPSRGKPFAGYGGLGGGEGGGKKKNLKSLRVRDLGERKFGTPYLFPEGGSRRGLPNGVIREPLPREEWVFPKKNKEGRRARASSFQI